MTESGLCSKLTKLTVTVRATMSVHNHERSLARSLVSREPYKSLNHHCVSKHIPLEMTTVHSTRATIDFFRQFQPGAADVFRHAQEIEFPTDAFTRGGLHNLALAANNLVHTPSKAPVYRNAIGSVSFEDADTEIQDEIVARITKGMITEFQPGMEASRTPEALKATMKFIIDLKFLEEKAKIIKIFKETQERVLLSLIRKHAAKAKCDGTPQARRLQSTLMQIRRTNAKKALAASTAKAASECKRKRLDYEKAELWLKGQMERNKKFDEQIAEMGSDVLNELLETKVLTSPEGSDESD